jgi:hypothetical protein
LFFDLLGFRFGYTGVGSARRRVCLVRQASFFKNPLFAALITKFLLLCHTTTRRQGKATLPILFIIER